MSDLEEGYYWFVLRDAGPSPIPFIGVLQSDGYVSSIADRARPLSRVEILSERIEAPLLPWMTERKGA
jgi:hypothetical protein